MAAVNTFLLSCAYSKLKYIAVSGGVLAFGEVENIRGKLSFTSRSFEIPITKLSEFFECVQQLGENLISTAAKAEKNESPLPSTSKEEGVPRTLKCVPGLPVSGCGDTALSAKMDCEELAGKDGEKSGKIKIHKEQNYALHTVFFRTRQGRTTTCRIIRERRNVRKGHYLFSHKKLPDEPPPV